MSHSTSTSTSGSVSFCRHHGLWLCVLAAASGSAAAATTYTYRELAKPLAATSCEATSGGVRFPGQHLLSDAAEVLGECLYFTGHVKSTDITGQVITVKSYARHPTVWSASGTPRTLSMPLGFVLNGMYGMDANGRVIGAVAPSTGNGNVQWYAWQGTQRSKFPLPSSLPSTLPSSYVTWGIQGMSHSGVFLLENTRDAKLAIWNGGKLEVMDSPTMPTCNGYVNTPGMVSDAGQAVVQTFCTDASNPTGPTFTWNQGAWQVVPNPVQADQALGAPLAVGTQGQMLFGGADFALQLWSQGTLTELPSSRIPSGRYFSVLREGHPDINAQGVIVGTGWFGSEPELAHDIYSLRAAVWNQGTVTNLNTVSNVPKGIVLNDAININTKGQILVQGWGNKTSGAAPTEHLGVLTPQ